LCSIPHVTGQEQAVRAAFQRLRKDLEEVCTPTVARSVLFLALEDWGPHAPSTRAELPEFVRGPLRRVLIGELGSTRAVSLLMELETTLAVVDSEDERVSLKPQPRVSAPMSATSTWALRPVRPGPVDVLVVSDRGSLGTILQLAVGTDAINVASATQLKTKTDIPKTTEIVLVDGARPPALEPVSLARAFDGLPRDVFLAVWAAEEPYGRELVHALQAGGIACMPFSASEGIAPFVDLVRSRRG
jgi:hypothetical protein